MTRLRLFGLVSFGFIFGLAVNPTSAAPMAKATEPRRGCATHQIFDWANQAQGAGPEADAAKAARAKLATTARIARPLADLPHARTVVTEHFQVHYALYGINQIKTVASDADLMALADSLRLALDALPLTRRDSAVYAALDARSAPHPDFAVQAAQILESAYRYYVDTLGMRNPQGTSQSLMFKAPIATGGRLTIDLADIGQFAPVFQGGEYYGLTIEPPRLAIIVENDFLFNTRLLPSGEIAGDSVSSRLNGRLIHNYAREYVLGLKLTIYHEFFHLMQYNYVPNHPRGYHAWYELSAVGMEERKVPEGNDYLQYLPCIFHSPEEVGLLATGDGVCNPEAAYSNGIFHMYLTHALGPVFDAGIWETLAGNGDRLPEALPEVLARFNHPIEKALPDFAARLLLAGRNSHPAHFVADMPDWPRMITDSLHPDEISTVVKHDIRPLAFYPLKLSPTFESNRVTASFPGMESGLQVLIREDTLVQRRLSGSSAPLQPWPVAGETWLVAVNLNKAVSGLFQVGTNETPFRVYPNPITLSVSNALAFSRSTQITYPARIELIDEAGRPVYEQVAADMGSLTDWNLRNRKNERIKPGVYYLRLNGGDWKPLLALP